MHCLVKSLVHIRSSDRGAPAHSAAGAGNKRDFTGSRASPAQTCVR
ncbi:hypothetical protein CBM2599_B60052 [Cupriavidus taiwanensis]|nr:hypothetical protein CBM2600_B80052 [Cupriavidus taiwanensis]SOZ06682.1 hypothetical protein CBM2599_B60052 [Cupriavidus taiwanensis]